MKDPFKTPAENFSDGAMQDESSPTCYFGILTNRRCCKTAYWRTFNNGQRTGIVWCDDHKPNSEWSEIRGIE